MPRIHVTKEFSFESAHRLPNYEGDCANWHGHSYKLQVTVSRYINAVRLTKNASSVTASETMVIDFKDLKSVVEEHVIKTHDHGDLNSIYHNPTAEVMVFHIYNVLDRVLPADLILESVRLWETATSFAEYRGEA